MNAESFSYDSFGNRLKAVDTTGDWTYNQNNELLTTPPSSSGSTGGSSFEYDPNGNMIQKTVDGVVTHYVYNVEDRFTEVWDGEVGTGSLIAEYYYDPFGRRLWKDVGGVRTYFHYADEGLVGEYDGTGAEIKTYGYKPGSTWTTDPIFIKQNNAYYFYHNDHLGTPQKITAMNGAIVWSAKYSSFGEATVEIENINNNLRFPGQYYDEETGLHYNYHRYYSVKTGRYLSVDPLMQRGGINLYLYSLSAPINIYDCDGALSFPKWLRPSYPKNWKEVIDVTLDYLKQKYPELFNRNQMELAKKYKEEVLIRAKNALIDCYNKKRKWLNDCKKFCKETYPCMKKREDCYNYECKDTFLEMWEECMPLVDKIEEIENTPINKYLPWTQISQ